jgi:hypothetical protein
MINHNCNVNNNCEIKENIIFIPNISEQLVEDFNKLKLSRVFNQSCLSLMH